MLYEGKDVKKGIFSYSKDKALYDNLTRYNYTHNDLMVFPRIYGNGWQNVKFREKVPQFRLKNTVNLDFRYLNDAIVNGAITLDRGKIYIVGTGSGKSYAVSKISSTNNVFLTTRLGLLDEFQSNAAGWERLSSKTVIKNGKKYYGTAQGISPKQIQSLKTYNYTFHIDEIHSWFDFDDLREKLNGILAKENNVIGYTASPIEQLMVWSEINDYEMVDCQFNKEKQKLNLALYKYHYVTNGMLSNIANLIQSVLNKERKVILYLNDKEKIETLAHALPEGKVYTYYTAELKDKTTRQEWEEANKINLTNFKKKKDGACLLCTSKLGLGANFHKVADMFMVFSNDPDGIQQVLARERDNDVTALIFAKTYSDKYLMHEVGWQDVLSDYFRGVTSLENKVSDKVFTKENSVSIKDCVKVIYETYSEVFFNNLFYILQENWIVVNARTPESRIFEIHKFTTRNGTSSLFKSNEERVYQGLRDYIRWLDNNQDQGIDPIFSCVNQQFDFYSPIEKDRLLKAFIDKYTESASESSLPPLRILLGMDKGDVLQTIRKVLKNFKQGGDTLSPWVVIKKVLQELDMTASFSDTSVEQISLKVNQEYPIEFNILKTILRQHYKYDNNAACWVRRKRNRKKGTTINRENDDKRLLNHLRKAGKNVTAKTVAAAMKTLQIKGNAETIARRLKRKL